MQLGCVTYNVLKDMDLETLIDTLEKAGYAAVELRAGHKHGVEPSLSAPERTAVAERFRRSKVRLLSFGSTCHFESPEAAARAENVAIAKTFVDLAHDTGARAVKVRPNGPFPPGVPPETTIRNIGASLHEVGEYGAGRGVEIWMEVHGRDTQNPPVSAAIMRAAKHDHVGLCWNSNPTDVVNGSVKPSFDLLRPWVRNAHINDLDNAYPWRELFALFNASGYQGYTLCECAESPQPARFLSYYKALWTELNRKCA